jgi:hypothetical protein
VGWSTEAKANKPITDYQAKSLKQYLKIALERSRVWKDKKAELRT